ncbi:efflux RND transporter periplasmic adaptor subunit [Rhodohalobacter sulfatireducens]|uniref:Efflux RND transporter periplasmic adaptor subunit n=1 Tax=Rhodohalobacter sulfatireducens TaxID=2911366 RepID=A0ABS9K956_9BACT|nr:efflux RND transporter periplasmic adaptor subunit [Rhodohalobacter sulfatireducens]MCG2587382.1 efflux RND transporter periplasmic adaptor subunit [Rhodohalobacter sulfatireducens]
MKGKKLWISLLVVIVLGSGTFYFMQGNASSEEGQEDPFVVAETGTVVEKALAVGTIEPENEIEIKSKISGVVSQIYAQPGEYVSEGQPLIEVKPDPTPLELAEAKRNLERTQIEKRSLESEMQRMQKLMDQELVSEQEYEQLEQEFEDVKIRLQISQERLDLLESGRVSIGDTVIESVIRAPVDGYILEKMVDIGEPVVPLTSYQAGTALMSIAGMDKLLFEGTVDEIDVGKMQEGMAAEIKIGALPDAVVYGEVSRISLKATQEDNATVFPVEITITDTNGVTLRAGYSANADIIIEQVENVITIPERVITMKDGKNIIEVPGEEAGSRVEKEVELGLSDAITVAVTEGLSEGDKVYERPVRTLTVR